MNQPEFEEMKIKALAPWFGGKRNLAPRIVQLLGKHSVYWEPFCGSMAVLLAKPKCRMETINDLHGDLINLSKVLQSDELAPKLYERLRRTLMCETLYQEAAERYGERGYFKPLSFADLDRAYDWFICVWQGINGFAGTRDNRKRLALRFTSKGGHAATRWMSAVDSIPAWHDRLRDVTILNRNGLDLLDRIEDESHVVIYVDPPYFEKADRYVYDFEPDDHFVLSEKLHRFNKTRVILSYYNHPLLNQLYGDFISETINVSKALAHQGKRGKNQIRANEVLLINNIGHKALFE